MTPRAPTPPALALAAMTALLGCSAENPAAQPPTKRDATTPATRPDDPTVDASAGDSAEQSPKTATHQAIFHVELRLADGDAAERARERFAQIPTVEKVAVDFRSGTGSFKLRMKFDVQQADVNAHLPRIRAAVPDGARLTGLRYQFYEVGSGPLDW